MAGCERHLLLLLPLLDAWSKGYWPTDNWGAGSEEIDHVPVEHHAPTHPRTHRRPLTHPRTTQVHGTRTTQEQRGPRTHQRQRTQDDARRNPFRRLHQGEAQTKGSMGSITIRTRLHSMVIRHKYGSSATSARRICWLRGILGGFKNACSTLKRFPTFRRSTELSAAP
jgi:hypothetical protein